MSIQEIPVTKEEDKSCCYYLCKCLYSEAEEQIVEKDKLQQNQDQVISIKQKIKEETEGEKSPRARAEFQSQDNHQDDDLLYLHAK